MLGSGQRVGDDVGLSLDEKRLSHQSRSSTA